MTPASLEVLVATAAGIAFVHTLVGVDHALPFVVLGRARRWSLRRVLGVTFLCGLAHVLSSVLLGLLGVALGASLSSLLGIESVRGEIAAWLLVGFGLAYASWAWLHPRGHAHYGATTVGALFVVFVLGPCEPLIPLLMGGAAVGPAAAVLVGLVFAAVTIGTMLAVVAAGYVGLSALRSEVVGRHAHTAAGLAVAGSGLAIHAFGI